MKKPSVEKFKEIAAACNGVIGKMAMAMGVYRSTIYDWLKEPKYKNVIEEYRGKLLDECLSVARLTALGIPKLDEKKRVIGWVEKPDSFMLRYLIGKLGSQEGYGESIDITSKGESIKPDPVVIEVIDSRLQVKKPEEGQEDG